MGFCLDFLGYFMYSIGEKIIYAESGVCTIEQIAPLASGSSEDRLYYHLRPLVGSGVYFAPVDSNAFMRRLISREEAESLIDAMPNIEPAICQDSRFNHVDAFYRDIFRLHTPEALVSIIKGLTLRMSTRKTKSSRAEATMKRAKEVLHGELSVALGMEYKEVEPYIRQRLEEA